MRFRKFIKVGCKVRTNFGPGPGWTQNSDKFLKLRLVKSSDKKIFRPKMRFDLQTNKHRSWAILPAPSCHGTFTVCQDGCGVCSIKSFHIAFGSVELSDLILSLQASSRCSFETLPSILCFSLALTSSVAYYRWQKTHLPPFNHTTYTVVVAAS